MSYQQIIFTDENFKNRFAPIPVFLRVLLFALLFLMYTILTTEHLIYNVHNLIKNKNVQKFVLFGYLVTC